MRSALSESRLELAARLEEPLAVAIFNVHLLGRSQIFADAEGGRGAINRALRGRNELRPYVSNLAAIVLETDFEPLPFDEAIDFFRSKLNLSPAQFDRLAGAARSKGFTLAGGATRQVRRHIMDLIDEALDQGVSLKDFQSRANEILDRAGVSARTPWYWETVYRTNLQTSYQAGRWKQMTDPEVQAERPFLQYFSARLPTSRPSHVEKHGIVLPVDHPFWGQWFPPNGFNCYCSAHSVSEREMSREGLRIADPAGFKFREPDQGFEFNPGKSDEI